MIKAIEAFLFRPKSATTLNRRDIFENNRYSLRETHINVDKIVSMKEWKKPEEAVFPEDLDHRQLFSYLEIETGMHNRGIIIVGHPEDTLKKICEH
jgi:hypothetical protein